MDSLKAARELNAIMTLNVRLGRVSVYPTNRNLRIKSPLRVGVDSVPKGYHQPLIGRTREMPYRRDSIFT